MSDLNQTRLGVDLFELVCGDVYVRELCHIFTFYEDPVPRRSQKKRAKKTYTAFRQTGIPATAEFL